MQSALHVGLIEWIPI